MSRPPPTGGMRHVALFVENYAECEYFYVELMGMKVEWRPDEDNVYLCSGNDNLALHRAKQPLATTGQHLDHIGYILREIEDVDAWHAFLKANDVTIQVQPRTHRDGARSFYCHDPDGNSVQLIYHPPISGCC